MESRYPGHPTYPLALLNFIAQFVEITGWLLRQRESKNWASVPVAFQTVKLNSPAESLRRRKKQSIRI